MSDFMGVCRSFLREAESCLGKRNRQRPGINSQRFMLFFRETMDSQNFDMRAQKNRGYGLAKWTFFGGVRKKVSYHGENFAPVQGDYC